MSDLAALDRVAADVYAVTPANFTATRNACAAADPDLATEIRSWRKPNVAAWAVNLLAQSPELSEALALADEVREHDDVLDSKVLARFGTRRRAAVSGLVTLAITRAAASGVALSRASQEDVAATINAALSDPAAAEAALSGRLVRPLVPGGFGPVDLTDALAGSVPNPLPAARDDLEPLRDRREAERSLQQAELSAEVAQRDLSRADGRLAVARDRAMRLQARADALRSELRRAEAESAAAAKEAGDLAREREGAVVAVRTTARAAVVARTTFGS